MIVPHRAALTAAVCTVVCVACALSSCNGGGSSNESAASYAGVDARGIPHYLTMRLSRADSMVLRRAYGIEDYHRLHVSDSTAQGILEYDTQVKRCRNCYVNSYNVGYISVRRPGESWEQVERRVRSTPAAVFGRAAPPPSQSTATLDPDIRPIVEAMLRDARAAGFQLRVIATYRSPLTEAYLMASDARRTHTLTSNHSYGRALDIVIDDGNRAHARTKHDWIAFRRWVTHYRTTTGESFRVLGAMDRTWDWPHVELPSSKLRFGNVEQAIARGRDCLTPGATITCDFPPHLPPNIGQRFVR